MKFLSKILENIRKNTVETSDPEDPLLERISRSAGLDSTVPVGKVLSTFIDKDGKYVQYRTTLGISRETGLPQDVVMKILEQGEYFYLNRGSGCTLCEISDNAFMELFVNGPQLQLDMVFGYKYGKN